MNHITCYKCFIHTRPTEWLEEHSVLLKLFSSVNAYFASSESTSTNTSKDGEENNNLDNLSLSSPASRINSNHTIPSELGTVHMSNFKFSAVRTGKIRFVGFFGSVKEDPKNKETFDLNDALINNLMEKGSGDFLGVASVHIKGSCNWVTMPLLAASNNPSYLRDNPIHKSCMEISPHYYNDIRIRQGVLDINDYSLNFQLQRTIEIDYIRGFKKITCNTTGVAHTITMSPNINSPRDMYQNSQLIMSGFPKRPLILISYLIPGIPESFYRLIIGGLQKILQHPVHLEQQHGNSLSGPISEAEESTFSDKYHLAALCCPSYLKLHAAKQVEIVTAPVYKDPRNSSEEFGYWGDFIVSSASNINNISQLKDCLFGYNDIISLSGKFMPEYYLARNNLPREHFQWVHTGGHRNSISKIIEGSITSACIDSHVLNLWKMENPEKAHLIKVISSVGPVAIPPFVISTNLNSEIKKKIIKSFEELQDDTVFKVLLEKYHVSGFVKPSEESVQKVNDIMSVASDIN